MLFNWTITTVLVDKALSVTDINVLNMSTHARMLIAPPEPNVLSLSKTDLTKHRANVYLDTLETASIVNWLMLVRLQIAILLQLVNLLVRHTHACVLSE